ncbi:YphA family membrane protein [Beduinella massiliensis]|uniref:YphA family membrane protein n=1 Tax=Beduinella massiliensis TaxID=1852363 RepID=UPI000C8210A8
MSIGMVLLTVLALLILFGVGQRVLDRMYLTDRQALLMVAAIFVGGWLPDLQFGRVTLNIGGALIPLGICIYLLVRAGTNKERIRALVAAVLTGAAVYLLGRIMPADPIQTYIDPNYVYGLAAGVVAYLLGRSRRAAFFAGVVGVLLADIAVGAVNWANGIDQTLHLGSAGALDAVVISGLLAVLLAEFVGEALERLTSGAAKEPMEDGAIATGRRKK